MTRHKGDAGVTNDKISTLSPLNHSHLILKKKKNKSIKISKTSFFFLRIRVRPVHPAGHLQSSVPRLVQLHGGKRPRGSKGHFQHRQLLQDQVSLQRWHVAAGQKFVQVQK